MRHYTKEDFRIVEVSKVAECGHFRSCPLQEDYDASRALSSPAYALRTTGWIFITEKAAREAICLEIVARNSHVTRKVIG